MNAQFLRTKEAILHIQYLLLLIPECRISIVMEYFCIVALLLLIK